MIRVTPSASSLEGPCDACDRVPSVQYAGDDPVPVWRLRANPVSRRSAVEFTLCADCKAELLRELNKA